MHIRILREINVTGWGFLTAYPRVHFKIYFIGKSKKILCKDLFIQPSGMPRVEEVTRFSTTYL